MKKNINKKLSAGFGICLLLIISVVGFSYFSLGKLEKLYKETLKRSVNMELATEAQHIGDEMYEAIANAIINQDLAKSEQEWAASKKDGLEKLLKVDKICETPEEQANVREAEQAMDEIIRIYEQEMLPLIRTGVSIPGPISAMDARVDKLIARIDHAMHWIAFTMSDKNQRAAREYNAILGQTRGFGFIVSMAGILVVIIVIYFATQHIVRPLAEITWAAMEIMKGNLPVELKHQSDDEIGVLADAFRDMSDKVEKRTAELQSSNEQLKHEIIERTHVEEELSQLNTQLEQLVEERTAELVGANEQCKLVIIAQRDAENELLRSREEMRNLSVHQRTVREEERKRISREIHDELGQSMTALQMDASWLRKKLRKDQTALCEKADSMTALIKSTIQSVQRIAAELRPSMLDDLGLKEAIEWTLKNFQGRTGIAVEFSSDTTDLNGDMEKRTAIFRIFQEAMTNVARHSMAFKVSVILEETVDMLALSVQDNGRGISDNEIADPKSLGLIGMRERARLCGGEVMISGSRHEGTMLKVIIPLDRKEEPRC